MIVSDVIEFIPNLISPIFKSISIQSEDDLSKLNGLTNKDIIDIEISNDLIESNRRVKIKLEKLIEDIPTTIKYTSTHKDDIKVEFDINSNSFIRKYIEEKYKDSELKEQLLNELNNLMNMI